MRKAYKISINVILLLLSLLCSNCYLFLKRDISFVIPFLFVFRSLNVAIGFFEWDVPSFRLKCCNHGVRCLEIFALSSSISVLYHIVLAFIVIPTSPSDWLWSIGIAVVTEIILFANGYLFLLFSSVQLGIRYRLLSLICLWIPVVNLVAVIQMIILTAREVRFESDKIRLNERRESLQICKTKYPILFVHGAIIREFKYLNYWGRVPGELKRNGATVLFSRHQAAMSIADTADELCECIKKIVEERNCEKVNVIAYSKGAMDIRYAMQYDNLTPYIASVTAISGTHKGVAFVDKLFDILPDALLRLIERIYNWGSRKLGNRSPDIRGMTNDLKPEVCQELDLQMPVPEGVFCQSFCSRMQDIPGDHFPFNITYLISKHLGGQNDGVVCVESTFWGEEHPCIVAKRFRGISHFDMVDMRFRNIPGFDVRELYVSIANDLRIRGL